MVPQEIDGSGEENRYRWRNGIDFGGNFDRERSVGSAKHCRSILVGAEALKFAANFFRIVSLNRGAFFCNWTWMFHWPNNLNSMGILTFCDNVKEIRVLNLKF